MNINEFNQQFLDELTDAITDEGGRISAISVPKNGVLLQGVTVRFDDEPSGIILYPDQYYRECQEGKPMNDIIADIKGSIASSDRPQFELESVTRETALKHLRSAVINYVGNEGWIRQIPHERLEDLAVYAKWYIGTHYATNVTGPMLSLMQMTKEEMLQTAKDNTAGQYKLQNMNSVMMEMADDMGLDGLLTADMLMEKNPLHVLSNKSGIGGASMIACSETLKRAHEELGEDFYILPSSVHEVILVAQSKVDHDVEALQDMVKAINLADVPVKDRLSDSVYKFDGRSLKLAGLGLTQENDISESITHKRGR